MRPVLLLAALVAGLLPAEAPLAAAQPATRERQALCQAPQQRLPLPAPPATGLPVDRATPATAATAPSPAPSPRPADPTGSGEIPADGGVLSANPGGSDSATGDYRDRLAPSPWGWVHLHRWCVWLEPAASGDAAAAQRERAWLTAVETALARWQPLVGISRSDDPEAAQVRVWRRRPPLRPGPDGRLRASHGRSQLSLGIAESGGRRWIEPRVEVWIGPGQGPQGLQATALHELGHAFGLWGHSPDAGDAMAAVPGARPVLQLSERDQASLRWLQAQPTRIGGPAPEPTPGPTVSR